MVGLEGVEDEECEVVIGDNELSREGKSQRPDRAGETGGDLKKIRVESPSSPGDVAIRTVGCGLGLPLNARAPDESVRRGFTVIQDLKASELLIDHELRSVCCIMGFPPITTAGEDRSQ